MRTHRLHVAIALGFLLLASSLPASAADSELEEKYEKKIAKPFVAHGGWILDYDEARAKAAKEKKFIFAYFTRSYAR